MNIMNTAMADDHLSVSFPHPARLPAIYLIDPNSKRRAAISHAITNSGLFVQPFEELSELAHDFPRSGIILVADEDQAVMATLNVVASFHRNIPVVAYSNEPVAQRIVQAVKTGAANYFAWPTDEAALPAIIMAIGAQILASNPDTSGHRSQSDCAKESLSRLSGREKEILAMVIEGMGSREIGQKCKISPRTVEIHRANTLRKLNVRNSVEAVRIAIEGGLKI